MANALIQFRADSELKTIATDICERLGLDLPTYMRLCIVRLVQANAIPFSMTLNDIPKNPAIEAMKSASQIAREKGISNMTLDEINAEIAEARK